MSKPQQEDADEIKAQFTQENFRSWLAQFSSRQKVGQSYNLEERPLARFMTEQVGYKAMVMPVRTSVGNCRITNPPWARAFIAEIDSCEPEHILKTRATSILNELDWKPGDPPEKTKAPLRWPEK